MGVDRRAAARRKDDVKMVTLPEAIGGIGGATPPGQPPVARAGDAGLRGARPASAFEHVSEFHIERRGRAVMEEEDILHLRRRDTPFAAVFARRLPAGDRAPAETRRAIKRWRRCSRPRGRWRTIDRIRCQEFCASAARRLPPMPLHGPPHR